MTQSTPPQSNPDGGYTANPAPVSPPAMSSPLGAIVAEKKRSSALGLLLGLALVVAVGGVAFAAGRLTAPTAAAGTGGTRTGFDGPTGASGFPGGFPGGSGAPGGFQGGANPLAGAAVTVTGTVQSISATSMTLQLSSGETLEIPIDSATTYHGQTASTAAAVKTGAQVHVELNAFGGLGGGGRVPGGGANASPPPPVGASGAVPPVGASGAVPSAGASRAPGGTGQGTRGAIGPAKDITIVTP